jgi:putative cell wall-binding protein
VVVAVIDSGVQRHADLVDNLLPGYDFVDGDADASDPGDGGWPQCPTAPSSWHGTHVAGVVAAAQNSIGVSGVAPRVKILPVRAMGACGRGNNVDILNGVLWAAGVPLRGVPTNPNPADIINLSLGGLGRCTTQEQQVFNLVTSQGVLVVAAAGNQSQPASYSAPANCWNTFSVGASATTGRRTRYSNFGSGVDVYAPGGDGHPGGILSTVDAGWQDPDGDAYQRQSGTSMAAPVVAGVAALMKSVNPNLTPLDLARGLRASATRCNGDTCPTGIVNARVAVDFARGVTGGGSGDDGDAVEPTLPPPPPPPDPQILPDPNDPDPSIAQSRYGGTSAFDVAAATARHVAMRRGFAGNNADMVAVLANAASFPDGLTASVVAGHHDAVILYVERDSIPRATELALAELRISQVVIVGGPAVVSETVVAALNAMGVTVMSRLWGDNRYLTADAVAREVMDAKAYLFIASGRNFADAVAAGPALYVGRYPMVLADRTGLSPATQRVVIDWYRSRPTGQVIILGGEAAVPALVETQLAQLQRPFEPADGDRGSGFCVNYPPSWPSCPPPFVPVPITNVVRLGGSDRYDTAARIAQWSVTTTLSRGTGEVAFATGLQFADALAAAPLMGQPLFQGPLLLTAQCTKVPQATLRAATGLRYQRLLGNDMSLCDYDAQVLKAKR